MVECVSWCGGGRKEKSEEKLQRRDMYTYMTGTGHRFCETGN